MNGPKALTLYGNHTPVLNTQRAERKGRTPRSTQPRSDWAKPQPCWSGGGLASGLVAAWRAPKSDDVGGGCTQLYLSSLTAGNIFSDSGKDCPVLTDFRHGKAEI